VNTVEVVELFYALLAVVANVVVVGVAVAVVAGHGRRLRELVGPSAIAGAFAVAVLATAGSLFFSEVARFEPCRLCWYQRILMYPLVVVLGIAAIRRDELVGRYVLPLASIGAVTSAYHYALEWFPALDTGACAAGTPCTIVWFRQLGFASLPYLALSAFLLIAVLVWLGASDGAGFRTVAGTDEVR
jgi:disulfide bond formation protein DsbB